MERTTAVSRSGWRTGPTPGKRAAILATTGSAAASSASASGAVTNPPARTCPAAAASAPASASTTSTGSATVPAGRAAVPTMAPPTATARSHTRPSQRSSRSSPERRYTSRLPARSTGPGTGTARVTPGTPVTSVLVDAERGGGRGRAGDPEVLQQDQLAPEQGRLGGQALGRRRDRQEPLLVGQVDLEAGRDQIGGGHRVVGEIDRLGLPAGHLQQGGDVAGEQPACLDRALLGRVPGGLGQLAHLGHDVGAGLDHPVDPEPAAPA